MMELWRRTVEIVTRMWRNLSAGQRAALVLLLGLLALFVGWGVTAAKPERMRVLVSAEEPRDRAAAARAALEERRIPYELRDGTILVGREHYEGAFLDLFGAGVFDDARLFDFLNRMSLTATRWERDRLWQVAVQRKIQQLIMALGKFRDVRVQFAVPTDPHHFGTRLPATTATVTAEIKAGQEARREDIRAIAGLLRGAIPNLQPEHIFITTVDARGPKSWRLPRTDDGTDTAYEWHEVENLIAADITRKVESLLSAHYPVTVAAQVTVRKTATERRTVAAQRPVAHAEEFSEREADSFTTGTAPGTAAVGTGEQALRAGQLSGPAIRSSERSSDARTESFIPSTVTNEQVPPGDIERVAVAVAVMADSPKDANGAPDQTKIDELKQMIQTAAQRGPPDRTPEVHLMFMGLPPPAVAPPVPLGERIRVWLLENWLRVLLAIALVLLATLVYRLAKQALAVRAAVELEQIEKAIEAETPEFAAAVEVEERTARMRTYIRDLVQKNPRAVVSILRRWMVGR